MARIVLASYMVRYPLGGMMSWVLQYLLGFQKLGHDVYFVEKTGYENECFNPVQGTMSDDCVYGLTVVNGLLRRFDMEDRWCFVDREETYHGLPRQQIEQIFRSADLYIEMGNTHGMWLEEAQQADLRVLMDSDPGFTQAGMIDSASGNTDRREYDYYYSNGRNVGTPQSSVPTAGRDWRTMFHPVDTELFAFVPLPSRGAFTTVMNWQSYKPKIYNGITYGMKDREFEKFITLPQRVSGSLEIAVSGNAPRDRLRSLGWRIRDAHDVTISFDRYCQYIADSIGEFSVCKHGYVVTGSGWFSDRSGAYLSTGRPVVLEDTGFSAHLPTGEGLFAVQSVEEAAAAIIEIGRRPSYHARRAREIAEEFLDARRVMSVLLDQLNI